MLKSIDGREVVDLGEAVHVVILTPDFFHLAEKKYILRWLQKQPLRLLRL